jgi:hypothetical protein
VSKKSNIVAEAKAEVKANKQPKTIKVWTLVKAAILTAVVIASFILGWSLRSSSDNAYNAAVRDSATQLVKSLK